MQSTPESGERVGYDGHKKKKGSKIHMAIDTLDLFLALSFTLYGLSVLCGKVPIYTLFSPLYIIY